MSIKDLEQCMTPVNSVFSIWEGMHEANGAGYRQGARLLAWASPPTPAPQCGVVDSSSCGAADGATRITPDAVCIPKRSKPRGGEGRDLEGRPRPARASAVGSTPTADADHFPQAPPTRTLGGKASAGPVREVGEGGDAFEPLEPPAYGYLQLHAGEHRVHIRRGPAILRPGGPLQTHARLALLSTEDTSST